MKRIAWFVNMIGLITPVIALAGGPLWTFTPLTATTFAIANSATQFVQYTVTNTSRLTRTLTMQPIAGVTQVIDNLSCGNPFTLAPNASCTLTLEVIGSELTNTITGGPVVCPQNSSLQCYQPSSDNALNISLGGLSLSLSTLALSVDCVSGSSCAQTNAQLTGTARSLTLTNTHTSTMTGITISYPSWPAGTSASSTCSSTLAPGASCTITITPGPNATSDCQEALSPTPGTILVTSDNAPSVSADVVVLTYGCIYQGGFVYSINDATSPTTSISGKTAAVYDTISQSNPIISAVPNWGGSGIDIGSATWNTTTSGMNNGSNNTALIIATLGCPVPTSEEYAACDCALLSVTATGTTNCSAPNTCYTGWYLPALCELSSTSDGVYSGYATCNDATAIQQQLTGAYMSSTLFNFESSGYYWSSTELASTGEAAVAANGWNINAGSGGLGTNQKTNKLAVRCSRAF